MRKIANLLLASTLLLGGANAASAQISKNDLNTLIDQTNFLVNNNCSGTLVDGKYILTANHCIQDQFQDVERDALQSDGTVKKQKVRISKPGTVTQITFAGPNEVSHTAYVVKIKAHDPDHDLGLMEVVGKLPNTESVMLSCKEPGRLDDVYSVGNPFAVLYSSVTKGMVSSTARDYRIIGIDGNGDDPSSQPGDNGLIQHTATIAPGNSGGALLDSDGHMIGVNVRGANGYAIYFAVPLDDVKTFLSSNGVSVPDCDK